MIRHCSTYATLVAGLLLISGCSKSENPAVTTGPSPGGPVTKVEGGAPKITIAPDAGPDLVVSTFLDATRSGNEAAATELLTSKAREETAKEGLSLDPPGTPSMKYKIAKVDYLEDNKEAAYVNSIWTETSEGREDSFEVVWVLRKQADGWRIAGMAAQNVPEEPPIFLNFEDPADVIRIKNQINPGEPLPTGEPGATPAAANTAQNPNGTAPLK